MLRQILTLDASLGWRFLSRISSSQKTSPQLLSGPSAEARKQKAALVAASIREVVASAESSKVWMRQTDEQRANPPKIGAVIVVEYKNSQSPAYQDAGERAD